MTIAELNRSIASYGRRYKERQKEMATHNYISSILIGRSIAAYFSNDLEMLKLEEAYPSLFDEKSEETKQKKEDAKTELSVLRFTQFANSYNRKYKQ